MSQRNTPKRHSAATIAGEKFVQVCFCHRHGAVSAAACQAVRSADREL